MPNFVTTAHARDERQILKQFFHVMKVDPDQVNAVTPPPCARTLSPLFFLDMGLSPRGFDLCLRRYLTRLAIWYVGLNRHVLHIAISLVRHALAFVHDGEASAPRGKLSRNFRVDYFSCTTRCTGAQRLLKSAFRAHSMLWPYSIHRFEAGVKYACNPKTVVRAKVNSAGVVTACALNKCADKVSVAVTGQVSEMKRENIHTRDEEARVFLDRVCFPFPPPPPPALSTPALLLDESLVWMDQPTSSSMQALYFRIADWITASAHALVSFSSPPAFSWLIRTRN